METDDETREKALNVIFGPKVPTAKVYKETPVKPGQQHPVAKGGHYRLWHEHVWPRGYTPQRLNEVRDLDYEVTGDPDLLDKTTSAGIHEGRVNRFARSIINRHLARSTAPIEDLKQIQRGVDGSRLKINLTGTVQQNAAGAYKPLQHEMSIKIDDNSTQVDEQRALIHEIGHAVDVHKRPVEFMIDASNLMYTPRRYAYGRGMVAHPKLEGIAEGYSLGHSRITRSGRRTGGSLSKSGYLATAWDDPSNSLDYVNTRNAVFHAARGTHPEEPPKEQHPEIEQPGLFD